MVDVLVLAVFGVGDIFDHDAVGGVYLVEVADDELRLSWHYFYVEACFLLDFTESRLDRVFIGIDVSAGWEPFLNFFVPVEEGGVVVDDEAGGGEVSGFGSWQGAGWIMRGRSKWKWRLHSPST